MLSKAFEEGTNCLNMRYRVGIEHDDIVKVCCHLVRVFHHLIGDLDESHSR